MRLKGYVPSARNINKRPFFDSLAAPYFHQGGSVGCMVLHGFTGTPANVRVVADKLARAGFTVYAPLLSGHGTTLRDMDAMTERAWINDAFMAYARLEEAGCTRIYAMGLSMGGLLAAIVAQEKACAGLVLMSTPFKMRKYLHHAGRICTWLPFILYDGEQKYQRDSYGQGYAGVPLKKLNNLEKLSLRARGGLYKITCPTLILQPANDKRVDQTSVMIAMHGVSSRLVTHKQLENSPHGCSYGPERELVAEHCLEFVLRLEKHT